MLRVIKLARSIMNKVYIRFVLFTIAAFMASGCDQEATISMQPVTQVQQPVVEASGELASSNTAVIGPPVVKGQWQFKLTFLVPEGTQVKEGQPIVGFDSSQLNQKLSVKKSELKTSSKNLENTKLNNESKMEQLKLSLAEAKMAREKARRKYLQSKELESSLETKKLAIELEKAENEVNRFNRTIDKTKQSHKTSLAIAKGKVERLKVEVKELELGIANMTIKAPKSGIAIYKTDYQGKKVSRGDNVWLGRQVLELPSLDEMIVKAQILEADTSKIESGMLVDVVLDAVPERIFKGKVKSLGNVFRRRSHEQPSIIFDAEIALLDADPDIMRPGMAVKIKVLADGSHASLSTQEVAFR